MPSIPPQLLLPKLNVDPQTIFSESPPDVRAAALLLSEFDPTQSPFFSGFPETAIPGPTQKTPAARLKDLGAAMLALYEAEGRGSWRPLLVQHHKKKGAKEDEAEGISAWAHADQRRVLERTIRILNKAGREEDVSIEMARAYLHRSRIIKPKGFTPPARKLEALRAAFEHAQKADGPRAALYRGIIALEEDRCGAAPEDFLAILESVRAAGLPEAPEDEEKVAHCQVLLRLAEKGKLSFDAPDMEAVLDLPSQDVPLERLKFKLFCKAAGPKLKKNPNYYRNQLVKILSFSPFSHPLWDETVRFIRRLHRWCAGKDGANLEDELRKSLSAFWKGFALKLWEVAEDQSRRLSDVHLRWYWSRQRDLYDLAFLAAVENKDFLVAARVADSAKSRPALTWQAMERMGDLGDTIEQYAQVLAGGYVKGMTAGKVASGDADAEIPACVPPGGRILQFYLVHLQDFERGYAVVCGEDGWTECRDFDFRPVWLAYQKWQSAYFGLPYNERDASAELLLSLCETMGKEMDFLFDLAGDPENGGTPRTLLFVPHDFLHRLPLHGAIQGKREDDDIAILLERCFCRYWPALSAASRPLQTAGERVRLLAFPETDDTSEVFRTEAFGALFDRTETPAGKEALLSAGESGPSFLAVFCHGKADPANPFRSRLMLREDLSVLELAGFDLDLGGAEVFLGACETDLVAPTDSPLDEHLTVADILIRKKAGRVIGTFWEAGAGVVEKSIQALREKDIAAVNDLEKAHFEDFIDGGPGSLFDGLVFKIYDRAMTEPENGTES